MDIFLGVDLLDEHNIVLWIITKQFLDPFSGQVGDKWDKVPWTITEQLISFSLQSLLTMKNTHSLL